MIAPGLIHQNLRFFIHSAPSLVAKIVFQQGKISNLASAEQLMSHRVHSVLAVALLASCVGSASGNLIFYDSFNYGPSGTSLGTAGSPTWVKNGSSPDPTVQNVGGLTYPGLQVSSDTKSLQYDGSGVNAGSGAPAATDGTHDPRGSITTGSLYYSLLLKVTAVQIGWRKRICHWR